MCAGRLPRRGETFPRALHYSGLLPSGEVMVVVIGGKESYGVAQGMRFEVYMTGTCKYEMV